MAGQGQSGLSAEDSNEVRFDPNAMPRHTFRDKFKIGGVDVTFSWHWIRRLVSVEGKLTTPSDGEATCLSSALGTAIYIQDRPRLIDIEGWGLCRLFLRNFPEFLCLSDSTALGIGCCTQYCDVLWNVNILL